jgi:hypothetical protein
MVNGFGEDASTCRIPMAIPLTFHGEECRPVHRTRPYPAFPALAATLLMLALAGCGDSSDPTPEGMTEAETSDVAEALADEGDQSLESLPFHRYDCAELSGDDDSDGDGTPDQATLTFALPACAFTGFRGGRLEITGSIVVRDPTPLVADLSWQTTLTDLTWRFIAPSQRFSYTAVRNGTRALTGSAAGFSLGNTITVDRTYPVRAPSTVSHDLLLAFTPAAGQSVAAGEPLPDGTFTKSGTFSWSRGGRTRTFVVTTPAALEWDASCPTDRKIVAGETRATLSDGSYIRTVWTGCGEEPTRTFVPAA